MRISEGRNISVLCSGVSVPPSTSSGINSNKEFHLHGLVLFVPSGSSGWEEEDPGNVVSQQILVSQELISSYGEQK